ncbi:hypothetical protein ABTF50_21335, partial [Acinetobacter baumannii]
EFRQIVSTAFARQTPALTTRLEELLDVCAADDEIGRLVVVIHPEMAAFEFPIAAYAWTLEYRALERNWTGESLLSGEGPL